MKAVKAIIDIVTFIVTQGAQIIEFVNTVLDAVIAIADGGGGGVPALVENALAKSIPVLIGVLAALLGVSGLADKVKKAIQSVSKPVNRAIDKIVDKIAAAGKKLWNKLKKKDPNKHESGGEKKKRLDQGLSADKTAVENITGGCATRRKRLPRYWHRSASKYQDDQSAAVQGGDTWTVRGVVNPPGSRHTGKNTPAGELRRIRSGLRDDRAQMEVDALDREMDTRAPRNAAPAKCSVHAARRPSSTCG
ncbi:hypothetical protein ACU686_25855 [Yinghuangia aomiensis]